MELKYVYFIFSNIKPRADSLCNQMSFSLRELLEKFFTNLPSSHSPAAAWCSLESALGVCKTFLEPFVYDGPPVRSDERGRKSISLSSSSSSLDSLDGKPTDRGCAPLSARTLQPVLRCLMQDSPVNPYNVSFLTLHKRQPVGGVSKGITGAGTHRQRCCHKQEGVLTQGWVMASTTKITVRWTVLYTIHS